MVVRSFFVRIVPTFEDQLKASSQKKKGPAP